MIVNLTQITLTPELIALGVCDLSPNFFKVLGGLLTEKSNWDDFTYIGKKLASFAVCGHNCGQSPTHALVSGDLPDAVVGVIRKELSCYGVKLIKVNNDNISYTFPGDCPVPALRGLTLHGGNVVNRVINKALTEVVAFDHKVNGQPVCVRIAGKPELEAAVAAIKATEAAAKATASVVVAILGEEVEVAADNSNMTEAQARAIVGNDAVEKVLSENCEPTGRVGFNGSCQGDELIEWSASIAAIDADGRDCRLEARYYTSREQEQSVIDGGDWSNIDWAVDHFRVC